MRYTLALVLLLSGCSGNSLSRFHTLSAKETRADAWHLKAYRNHKYVFEHKGRIIIVKCVHSLSWPEGPGSDNPVPIGADGDCVYITPNNIGEYFGNDLMFDLGTQLRYMPLLGMTKLPVADVFEIESEEGQ